MSSFAAIDSFIILIVVYLVYIFHSIVMDCLSVTFTVPSHGFAISARILAY